MGVLIRPAGVRFARRRLVFLFQSAAGGASPLTNNRNFVSDGVGWHEIVVEDWGSGTPAVYVNPTQEVGVPGYGVQCDTVRGDDGNFYTVTVGDWGGNVYGVEIDPTPVAESNVFQSTLNTDDLNYYDLRYAVSAAQPYLNQL